MKTRVGIVMGSDSDLPVMRGASAVLDGYGIGHEVRVLSAHRSPAAVADYATAAAEAGIEVIIAGAGLAAHLAGAVASHTRLPVIGVPLAASAGGLGGADALFSTVQMPPGVPVATVGVGAAKNAAHLAARILAVADPRLADLVEAERDRQARAVAETDRRLGEAGIDAYVAAKARGGVSGGDGGGGKAGGTDRGGRHG